MRLGVEFEDVAPEPEANKEFLDPGLLARGPRGRCGRMSSDRSSPRSRKGASGW